MDPVWRPLVVMAFSFPDVRVTFEHHKELLLMQMVHEKLQHQYDTV